ncbi:hypothetical protein Rhe02_54400 [Rhizocola hellebori]|uniref:Uncharacterized protein n=1 Tax=Rhizocola hellebori TaxID=1392758 RepID=A0A8J3QCV5_9ACTN|nr:hypothetical protein [Rhizocola hellebori]GIH07373.1 hypothetical protein Rhe02_54400 [Rhizocola hellebori]
MTMQHLTECVVGREPIEPEVSIAHRPGKGKGAWPACMPRRDNADPAEWRELSVGRALELGAVPCTEKACTEVAA